MRLHLLGELPHRGGVRPAGRQPAAEAAGEGVEALVLEQRLDEERGSVALLVREQREELLLLLAEVPQGLGREELEEARDGGQAFGVVAAGGAAQPACLHERVVVVVRERDKGRMPLHLRWSSMAGPASRLADSSRMGAS